MERDDDLRLGRLLQTLAPPARDPLFRIEVLEARERRRFVRRATWLLAAGALAVAAYAIAVTAGETSELARVSGMTVAGALAAAMYVPALLRAVGGMRA